MMNPAVRDARKLRTAAWTKLIEHRPAIFHAFRPEACLTGKFGPENKIDV